jgi:dienelactone hydrolase
VSYAHALAAEWPAAADLLEGEARVDGSSGARALAVGRRGRGDRVGVRTWAPTAHAAGAAVLVVHPDGVAGVPAPIVEALRRRGRLVASLDAFNTGAARAPRDTSDPYFTTYNRTDDALRVQDVLTVLAWLKHSPGVRRVSLLGLGRAGLWALLAAGLAPDLEAVAADVDRFPTSDDEADLGRVFVPLFRKAGGFETAILLGLGARVLVHDTGDAFGTARVEEHARAIGALGRLRVERAEASEARIVAWVTASR